MLDSSPLGRLAHPRPTPEIVAWLADLLNAKTTVFIPEIADYEIRRNLELHGLTASIAELDRLQLICPYVPLTTPIMRRATSFWASARRAGRPAADPKKLDADVILAAQAIAVSSIVATENVGHIAPHVTAKHWRQIQP